MIEDAWDDEEEAMLLVEIGYADEAVDDRLMPPNSLVFPNFIYKSHFMMQAYIWKVL